MADAKDTGATRPVLYAVTDTGARVTLRAHPSSSYGVPFVTLMVPTLAAIAALDRPAAYHRTLMAALIHLDPINWRSVSARRLAETAGLSRISTERALAMLEADRVILGRGRASAKERRLSRELASASSAATWREANAREPDMEVIDGSGR